MNARTMRAAAGGLLVAGTIAAFQTPAAAAGPSRVPTAVVSSVPAGQPLADLGDRDWRDRDWRDRGDRDWRAYRDGYQDGYRDGWRQAREDCDEDGDYRRGWRWDRDYARGYDRGFERGFDAGYRYYCD
ncbi:hypothetical protein GCM10009682_13600 [Luedemannella flava]|uniref:BA14K family protein n=1 Tax=Luedemannella flava TaxID=349316 RepID=A0ABP4XS40_9ACTN